MSGYRIFVAVTTAVAVLILLLTQVVGGTDPGEAVPELEPIPAPTSTQPTPQPGETPGIPEGDQAEPAPVGAIIYEHDFSTPTNGPLAGQSSDTGSNQYGSRSATYTDRGTLLVRATSELIAYVAGANTEGVFADGRELVDLADVSVEVEATPVEVGDPAAWGLACRRDRGVGRFYFAFVGDAGGHSGAGIVRQDESGEEWTQIASEPLPAEVVIGDGLTNRLRLDCLGSTITLYVDGRKVVEGTDTTYTFGAAALFVNPQSTFERSSAEIEFDNLLIREA